jgi:hypothetical protein
MAGIFVGTSVSMRSRLPRDEIERDQSAQAW